MEDVEIDADVGLAALGDQCQRGIETGAKRAGATELERQADAEAGRRLGRLAQRHHGPVQVHGFNTLHEISHDQQRGDVEALA